MRLSKEADVRLDRGFPRLPVGVLHVPDPQGLVRVLTVGFGATDFAVLDPWYFLVSSFYLIKDRRVCRHRFESDSDLFGGHSCSLCLEEVPFWTGRVTRFYV